MFFYYDYYHHVLFISIPPSLPPYIFRSRGAPFRGALLRLRVRHASPSRGDRTWQWICFVGTGFFYGPDRCWVCAPWRFPSGVCSRPGLRRVAGGTRRGRDPLRVGSVPFSLFLKMYYKFVIISKLYY